MGFQVTTDHLERLAIGAGILGTGGGGNPYIGRMTTTQFLAKGATVNVVDLADVPDDAVVVTVGRMGAPTVAVERIPRGDEQVHALAALEAYTGKKVTHLVSSEIGGANSTIPMVVASQTGLPVIDADGMGRAFPELQMKTFIINGIAPTPGALCDHYGQTSVFDHITDGKTFERYMRAVTIQMGGSAGYCFPLMTGQQVRDYAVPATLSLAIRLGDAILNAREQHTNPVQAALDVTGGQLLFTGKITDVERRLIGGFTRGLVSFEGIGHDTGSNLGITFQNENLIARKDDGTILAVVPDLVCIVDADTAEPITTELLRYGMRAAILGIPAPVQMKTDAAIASVGPAAFGYPDVPFTPLPGVYGASTVSIR